jgi:hypothetical protein
MHMLMEFTGGGLWERIVLEQVTRVAPLLRLYKAGLLGLSCHTMSFPMF